MHLIILRNAPSLAGAEVGDDWAATGERCSMTLKTREMSDIIWKIENLETDMLVTGLWSLSSLCSVPNQFQTTERNKEMIARERKRRRWWQIRTCSYGRSFHCLFIVSKWELREMIGVAMMMKRLIISVN